MRNTRGSMIATARARVMRPATCPKAKVAPATGSMKMMRSAA